MSLKSELVFFALFISFCLFHQYSANIFFEYEEGDFCTTPNKQSGICIELYKCPHLLDVFERKEESFPAQKKYLRNAKCKIEHEVPIVCCDTDTGPCITPEDQIGTCVPVDRCNPLKNFFQFNSKRTDYKEASRCEYQVAKEERFCCPLFTNVISGNIIIKNNLSALPIGEKIEEEKDSGQNVPNPLNIPGAFEGLHSITGDATVPAENRVNLPVPGERLDQCGTHDIADKIINGDITDIYEYPWMALLKMGNGEYACGASLINNRYILTAAHCVSGPNIRNKNNVTMVRLGEWDLSSEKDCVVRSGIEDCTAKPVDIPPEEIIVHTGYTERTLENDIALIRLQHNVVISDFIKPVCLPTIPLGIKQDEKFIVAGWGATETGSQSDKKLHLTNLFLSDISQCGSRNSTINQGQLCIASRISQGTCNGDSGGPLMVVRSIPALGLAYYQVGIVSYGTTVNCGQRPNIYTNVENYMNWIRNNMKP